MSCLVGSSTLLVTYVFVNSHLFILLITCKYANLKCVHKTSLNFTRIIINMESIQQDRKRNHWIRDPECNRVDHRVTYQQKTGIILRNRRKGLLLKGQNTLIQQTQHRVNRTTGKSNPLLYPITSATSHPSCISLYLHVSLPLSLSLCLSIAACLCISLSSLPTVISIWLYFQPSPIRQQFPAVLL